MLALLAKCLLQCNSNPFCLTVVAFLWSKLQSVIGEWESLARFSEEYLTVTVGGIWLQNLKKNQTEHSLQLC